MRTFALLSTAPLSRGPYSIFSSFPVLGAIVSALVCAGCASSHGAPQAVVWQPQTSDVVTGSVGPGYGQAESSAASRGVVVGWGPYSGSRGQTEPPADVRYVFKAKSATVDVSYRY